MGDVKYFWNATQSFASSLINNVQTVQRLTMISPTLTVVEEGGVTLPKLRHAQFLHLLLKLFRQEAVPLYTELT